MPGPSKLPASIRSWCASAAIATLVSLSAHAGDASCVSAGTWEKPGGASPAPLTTHEVLAAIARDRGVLLGETHDDAEHHRWQLHVVAALYAREPSMVLAFEMFPRRLQPILDRWTAGELTEQQFLSDTQWNRVWGVDPKLYMPLFDFARMYHIPMLALNVERDLVRRTGKEGWSAIPPGEREGVGNPAPPDRDYVHDLYDSYTMHKDEAQQAPAANPTDAQLSDPRFVRFVESMQVWDRAMAEAIARRVRDGAPLVVGIMGSGHLRNRFGVPHQLRNLGIEDVAVLLPWTANADCDQLVAGVADYVFGVQKNANAEADRPRLGITLDQREGAVAIREVVKGSVADQAGAQAGDIIQKMAGLSVKQPDDVVAVVQRQAPGTWLPMTVERDGRSIELVARFPATK